MKTGNREGKQASKHIPAFFVLLARDGMAASNG